MKRLHEIICGAIKDMSAQELGELLRELSKEFGVAVSVPAGPAEPLDAKWVAIPREWTPEMLAAAGRVSWTTRDVETGVRRLWANVLEVTPKYDGGDP